ncbi:hypothetical protein [Chryseobacterium endalhagicum]|nr:hypothetical protein [Chryseobacterium endalhagicum]
MEGKKIFNYETAENRDSAKGNEVQETLVKILQVIIGFVMAILHM